MIAKIPLLTLCRRNERAPDVGAAPPRQLSTKRPPHPLQRRRTRKRHIPGSCLGVTFCQRRNLLGGIDLVAASIAEGTFHHVGPKGAASPAQAGHLTLALLNGVDAELTRRSPAGIPTPNL